MRMAIVLAMVALVGTARADDAPSVVVVIDRSLADDKLAAITESLAASARAMPAQTELAVVLAGERPALATPLGSAPKATIRGVRGAARGDLVAALRFADRLLAPSHRKKRRVLVVSNGDELTAVTGVARELYHHHITVSAIGYQSMNRVVLDDLATGGGGRMFLTDNPAQLAAAFASAGKLVPDVPPRQDLALAIVIDASVAIPEAAFEAAKESARVASEVLAPDDEIAVFKADHDATQVLEMRRAGNHIYNANQIARIERGGRSDLPHGLEAAYKALAGVNASSKVVVLITSGNASMEGVTDAVQALSEAHALVIVVGVGAGADRANLEAIVQAGQGRLYMVEDLGALPKVFFRAAPEPAW